MGVTKLPASFELVLNFLLQMNAQKSMGLNGIHPRILKEMSDGSAGSHYLSTVL